MLKLNEHVTKLNKKLYEECMDKADFYGNLDDAKRLGHNKLVSELDKFVMDEEGLANIIFNSMGRHAGCLNYKECLNMSQLIISYSPKWIRKE